MRGNAPYDRGLFMRTAIWKKGFDAVRLHWPRWRKYVAGAFFLLVAILLVRLALGIDWREVARAFRALSPATLAIAGGLAVLSYGIYCSYDLLGRYLTGHSLGTGRVMLITFISYAFNLSFGAMVGGAAFRFRLYSRAGIDPGTITRVLATSVVTNWVGYLLLAGVLLATRTVSLPDSWVGGTLLQAIGAGLTVLFAAYLSFILLLARPELRFRGHELPLPGRRLAWLQVTMSVSNWVVMGAVVYTLLPDGAASYPVVLGALLLGAIAGVVTHIPAGVGVIEAVFLAVLGGSVPQHQVLASLLAYRVVYYLVPLAIAAVAYVTTEASRGASGVAREA